MEINSHSRPMGAAESDASASQNSAAAQYGGGGKSTDVLNKLAIAIIKLVIQALEKALSSSQTSGGDPSSSQEAGEPGQTGLNPQGGQARAPRGPAGGQARSTARGGGMARAPQASVGGCGHNHGPGAMGGGGQTPAQPGSVGGGGQTPAQPGTVGGGGSTPSQPSWVSGGGYVPPQPGKRPGGMTPPKVPTTGGDGGYYPPVYPTGGEEAGEFRSIDGSGNNLANPGWGRSGSNFVREFTTDPSRDPATNTLPSGRSISNAVSNQNGQNLPNAQGRSDMLWLFGQFVDHDFAATPVDRDNPAPIDVPGNDAIFGPRGINQLGFSRSALQNGEQFTENSHFLDLGQVYGQTDEQAQSLRSGQGGQMLIGEDGLLPTDENDRFIAGDGRASENAALTSMHVVWLREHNRLAEGLAQQNPDWDDQRIYQEARKLNVAQYQSVVYNEFLPSLLGRGAISDYQGYDKNTDPRLSNAFATAAYRFGHTMVSENILRVDADGNEHTSGHLKLRDAFFNPDAVRESGVDPLLRGLATQQAQSVDPMLVESLRSFLFQQPGPDGQLVGSDLAALNIQRGRDHHIPSYNDVREQRGLQRIESFDDPIFQNGIGERLAQVYDSPDDIDLWVGGLAEQSVGGSMLGQSFSIIVAEQFQRLRDGDRFFYKNHLSDQEIAGIESTSMADIIERNTGVEFAQDNVFNAAPQGGNRTPEPDGNNNLQLASPNRQPGLNLPNPAAPPDTITTFMNILSEMLEGV